MATEVPPLRSVPQGACQAKRIQHQSYEYSWEVQGCQTRTITFETSPAHRRPQTRMSRLSRSRWNQRSITGCSKRERWLMTSTRHINRLSLDAFDSASMVMVVWTRHGWLGRVVLLFSGRRTQTADRYAISSRDSALCFILRYSVRQSDCLGRRARGGAADSDELTML